MQEVLRELKHRLFGVGVKPIPLKARHVEHSIIHSSDDDPAKPSDRLLDLALRAADNARSISMKEVSNRIQNAPFWPDIWPGEHYKFLAGLVSICEPRIVVEIGTDTGLSALAMRQTLPKGSQIVTFDIVPWDQISATCLRSEDFEDGSLTQIIGDVSDPAVMAKHAQLFRSAEIIFADGPKDGVFEKVFMNRLIEIGLRQNPVLVLDDIRVWNMLAIWREIKMPKLDITSFGHWSGTGLVDWIAK